MSGRGGFGWWGSWRWLWGWVRIFGKCFWWVRFRIDLSVFYRYPFFFPLYSYPILQSSLSTFSSALLSFIFATVPLPFFCCFSNWIQVKFSLFFLIVVDEYFWTFTYFLFYCFLVLISIVASEDVRIIVSSVSRQILPVALSWIFHVRLYVFVQVTFSILTQEASYLLFTGLF